MRSTMRSISKMEFFPYSLSIHPSFPYFLVRSIVSPGLLAFFLVTVTFLVFWLVGHAMAWRLHN